MTGRPCTFPEPWASLVDACGGVAALADALDVTPRTLRRWAHGERSPHPLMARAVRALARRRGVKSPVESEATAARTARTEKAKN